MMTFHDVVVSVRLCAAPVHTDHRVTRMIGTMTISVCLQFRRARASAQ